MKTDRAALTLAALFTLSLALACAAQPPELTTRAHVDPPYLAGGAHASAAELPFAPARTPDPGAWTWSVPKASVTPTGDLLWNPEPFVFTPGPVVRYIDFEDGSDANDGLTKDTPWKRHPWDAQAAGVARSCTGAVTYVFKRGAVYRGMLRAVESGSPGNPIRLTSDPKWGEGDAVICGAELITGGWKRLDSPAARIPEPDKVWFIDLPFLPRCVWAVTNGGIERVNLARTPNWRVTNPEDVMSEWWTWENPQWWKGEDVIQGARGNVHLGIDTKHLTNAAEYYVGAIVRTEYAIVMGTPFPTLVEAYDAQRKGIGFQGIWYGTSEKIARGNRYFLEDKPQYLDEPGEFWFERKGPGGRLYIRLSGDRDPNSSSVEAARHINLIESDGMSHVRISGLAFRFSNIHWDTTLAHWGHKDVNNACVRVLGSANDVRVANCTFEHVGKAVRIALTGDSGSIDDITVSDNVLRELDHGAIELDSNAAYAGNKVPSAFFGSVKVLRNRLDVIGLRAFRQDHSHAVCINFPLMMEVAGNIMHRCYGSGIFVFGSKPSGNTSDRPFARHLIYHNKVTDSLLSANDWGGIETWQGGPFYLYNNISGNPNGYWNWAYQPKGKENSGRLGCAYYLDGSSKNYLFNNVAWGNNNDLSSPLCNHGAFTEATPTIENAYFNNTIHKFAVGSYFSPAGGRHLYLGNLWMDISSWVFNHGQLKEDVNSPTPPAYPHFSIAYGRNVFYDIATNRLAVFEASGTPHAGLDAFKQALAKAGSLCADAGVMATSSPVRNAAARDFIPSPGSPAIDYGAKVFVPWALYATVGEWHFRRNNADPSILIDNHWNMTSYRADRGADHIVPTCPLTAVNVSKDDYAPGTLENWTDGALRFNGKDQYAVARHAEMTKPYHYSTTIAGEFTRLTAEGSQLSTPDIDAHNFLIELYFRTAPGRTASVLVAKAADAGYRLALNNAGGITLMLTAGRRHSLLVSNLPVNDGGWHHVIAETDRAKGIMTLYVDGRAVADERIALAAGASLSNTGDLYVARGPEGHYFEGEIDFLRIARGTLADARTTIGELYDWEFAGPFLRDFAGRPAAGKCRDAGAFEAQPQ